MKNLPIKIYCSVFMLFSYIALYSQEEEPGDEGEGGMEGGEDAPIDGMLLWLAVAGIVFAFYYFMKVKQKPSNINN